MTEHEEPRLCRALKPGGQHDTRVIRCNLPRDHDGPVHDELVDGEPGIVTWPIETRTKIGCPKCRGRWTVADRPRIYRTHHGSKGDIRPALAFGTRRTEWGLFLWEPRDLWIGTYVAGDAVYVCLVPMLVIKLWRPVR
jgi:hypothetical protein